MCNMGRIQNHGSTTLSFENASNVSGVRSSFENLIAVDTVEQLTRPTSNIFVFINATDQLTQRPAPRAPRKRCSDLS